ncbi:GNAT family N-acetyltransferase [Arthrobacter psychrochitiniphilus]|uniref:GNAT family N-acetyltransferase n=1 Tax=Arthrobacter psychrochitiniphilus TaxID=291045 RepID=A0A2V3DTL5_9MICC|nr:GNAT family N-acetyltransferase [Arthrobacter psychrochitiniphilus]NYG18720.1 ribosomal protein S18 acetylase RimI-like enzyme [Arthrobacter psychrochitiniphilus]PXA66350.1 GNAT family N-acetyltransferase [Arthrobacter psychrochitiniphilus]
MQLSIRRARASDAEALAALAALTFPLACPPETPATEIAAFIEEHLSPKNFRAYLADPCRVLFTAQDQSPQDQSPHGQELATVPRLLAYTMVVDAPPAAADVAALITEPGAVEFSKCYAHPDTHGSGVASAIMSATLQWIGVQGQRPTWLGVNSKNVRAQAFYRKHGFAVVGTRSFQLRSRAEHDFVMVRSS